MVGHFWGLGCGWSKQTMLLVLWWSVFVAGTSSVIKMIPCQFVAKNCVFLVKVTTILVENAYRINGVPFFGHVTPPILGILAQKCISKLFCLWCSEASIHTSWVFLRIHSKQQNNPCVSVIRYNVLCKETIMMLKKYNTQNCICGTLHVIENEQIWWNKMIRRCWFLAVITFMLGIWS